MAHDVEPVLQDLTHLDWSESGTTSATGGSYLKARTGDGAQATYYKLSCYDETNGVYGHECVNEIVAARLMSALCIRHVPYRLVHARVLVGGTVHETWLCESPSYRNAGQSKVSLARFFGLNHLEDEGRLAFCERFGWMQRVQEAMLVDYLIANRDRHGANLEVVKGVDGRIELAPLFDNGLSLFFSTYSASQLADIDPLMDIVANNYLGTRSLESNLVKFVPGNLAIGRLHEAHEQEVMQGLAPSLEHAVEGIDGASFARALWNFIWKRWCRYEDLRNSGLFEAQG